MPQKNTQPVEATVQPLENAAVSIGKMRIPPEKFLKAIADVSAEITSQFQTIKTGNTAKIEEMLYAQALTLDAAFYKFLTMAAAGTNQNTLMADRFELIASLAAITLKAQDQSRKTLIALTEMKNPKRSTTFIKNYVDSHLAPGNIDVKTTTTCKRN